MTLNHLIHCCLLLRFASIFPSIRVFSSELALCIMWPKIWSFNFSNSPSNDYSGLVSFRTEWFDLLASQGILKSVLQHHSLSINSSVLSFFFFFLIVQISYPYMTTGKNIALTVRTFVDKVMSLLFNIPFRFAIAFLLRIKCLLPLE